MRSRMRTSLLVGWAKLRTWTSVRPVCSCMLVLFRTAPGEINEATLASHVLWYSLAAPRFLHPENV